MVFFYIKLTKLSLDFKRGNIVNIAFAAFATLMWIMQKSYYKYRNAKNARLWAAMSKEEREREQDPGELRGRDGSREYY